MKIFKSIALFSTVAFFTMHVSAQTSTQNSSELQQMAQKMTAEVKSHVTGITPDQESKIVVVEKDFAQGMNEARNQSNGDRDAMRTKMQPLKKTRDAKIKTILTADQYAQYEKSESGHAGGR
jgi:hypothetical protein